MYTLYYMPGACSLATQVVLNELNQTVTIVNKDNIANFCDINPADAVPVLVDGGKSFTEGAAIMLYLLNKHESSLFPKNTEEQQKAIEDIMFANATMHPAYSKLFFIAKNIHDESAKQQAFVAAAENINNLWQVVEHKLAKKAALNHDKITAAEIMLSVYQTWGQYFPVTLTLGERTSKVVTTVQSMPSFQKAVQAEEIASAS